MIKEEHLKRTKAKFDYLNNLKMDTDDYAKYAVESLQDKTYI